MSDLTDPFVCSIAGRETWVPPERRNMNWMMENSGMDSAHSFVYFPKVEISTDFGPLICLQVPVGAKFYRGVKKMDVQCNQVNNPNNASCRKCRFPHWFADYLTAGIYGKRKQYVYVYEVKQPLYLFNSCDIRNLTVLLHMMKHQKDIDSILARHPEYLTNTNLYRSSWATNEEDPLANQKASIDFSNYMVFLNFINTLRKAFTYPFSRDFIQRYIPDIERSDFNVQENTELKIRFTARRIPARAAYEAEFGDQGALLRNSNSDADRNFMETVLLILRDYIPNLDEDGASDSRPFTIHGYYSPLYQSSAHNIKIGCGEATVPAFHREIGLFFAKGLLKRLPSDPRNGCVFQAASVDPAAAGATRKRKRRNNQRKSRRNSK